MILRDRSAPLPDRLNDGLSINQVLHREPHLRVVERLSAGQHDDWLEPWAPDLYERHILHACQRRDVLESGTSNIA